MKKSCSVKRNDMSSSAHVSFLIFHISNRIRSAASHLNKATTEYWLMRLNVMIYWDVYDDRLNDFSWPTDCRVAIICHEKELKSISMHSVI